MKIQEIIGQEVYVSIPNKDFELTGILHDVDAGGILIEVTSISNRTSSSLNPFPFNKGDLAYIKDKGFHLAKTLQTDRDIKLNQLV